MTKDDVLAILLKSSGYVSGELISSHLKISRAAVNGAVKALRADGCVINSVTNRGYQLISCPDRLFAGEVYSYIDDSRRSNVICLPSVDSTNNRLKDMLKQDLPSGTCMISNEQTGGRGRMGRTFVSPPNTGIYMSMLIKPTGDLSDMSKITAWTAVAVHKAILSACGVTTGIKWVNDLYIGNRKISGILTEMTVESEIGMVSNVIIGIGINVNQKQSDFPPELSEIATSIAAASGSKNLSRARLAAEVIKELDLMMDNWESGSDRYIDTYRSNCITTGKHVTVTNYATGDGKSGIALDVNDDYSLKVRYDDGTEDNVRSGEVSVKW